MARQVHHSVFRRCCARVPLLSCLCVVGCSTSGIERERPNDPPETRIVASPPDGTGATSYRVALEWTGNDPDGVIDHFDLVVVNHPSPCDSAAGLGFAVTVPVPGDPRWRRTSRRDSVVVVSADSLCRDPRPGSGETPEDVLREALRRWHTVFVRSVDNRGMPDPTPDYRTFNARTFAPSVVLQAPVVAGNSLEVPATCRFRWSGEDPVDASAIALPDSSRWVAVRVRRTTRDGWIGMPESLYALAPSRWSPWKAWNAADGSGVSATLRNLVPVERTDQGFYLFAVQAKDEAGAVTPVFDDRTPGKNNVVRILVNSGRGPTLIVRERSLGTYTFLSGSRPVALTTVRGQLLDFHWRADASAYGLDIQGYRYGIDMRDPYDDDAWACGWSPACTAFSAPVAFAAGIHRVWIQAIDTGGFTVEMQMELSVFELAPSRPFDPANDIYDATLRRSEPPPLNKIFDYKAVVWCVRRGQGGTTLSTLGRFFDPFVPWNQNAVPKFNYLHSYVGGGGEFWLSGAQPTEELWDFGSGPPQRPYPLDVVHWDDYRSPHPQEDSVGVHSLLYDLGAEIVDKSAAHDTPGALPTGEVR